MKKDIYIIKNTVNNKVYIGQSHNIKQRWAQHLSAARKHYKFPIYDAMNEYGIDKFYYQIVEPQVDNYDEREMYWIEYYNSRVPTGYNSTPGGKGSGAGINNVQSKIHSESELVEISNTIKDTKMSFDKIANMYNLSTQVICSVNSGKYGNLPGYSYPLRTSRYEKEKVKQIIYSLKYEFDKTLHDIATEYQVDISQVSKINSGEIYKIKSCTYPLRSGKVYNPIYMHINEIISLLKNTNMQQKEIAKKFNVSVSIISGINKGRSYIQDNIDYPIRKNYQCCNGGRKCFSPNEIRAIENELKNRDKSIRDIAKEFECGITTIMNINIGSIIKYKNNNISYPIRK